MPRPKRTKITDTRPSASKKATHTKFTPKPLPRTKQLLAKRTSTGAQRRDIDTGTSPARSERKTSSHGATASFLAFDPHSSSPRIVQPPSVARAQTTPSFLQLSNFKRRPRQPSLLRMVRQETGLEDSHRDDSDLEDSILRDLEASSPVPHRQSISRLTDGLISSGSHTSTGRKRKASSVEEIAETVLASSPPIGRRTETLEAHLFDHWKRDVEVLGTASDPHGDVDEDSVGEEHSPRPFGPAHNRLTSGRTSDLPSMQMPSSPPLPQALSSLVNSNLSNSMTSRPVSALAKRKLRGRVHQEKQMPPPVQSSSPPINATSPVSSPSSIQAQPPRCGNFVSAIKVTHRRSGKPVADATPVEKQKTIQPTTAALKALLPKRRAGIHRLGDFESTVIADEFDLPSSSGEEVSIYEEHRRRQGTVKSQPLKAKSANARIGPVGSYDTPASRMSRGHMKSSALKGRSAAALRRTYGRRNEEQENKGLVSAYDLDDEGDEIHDETTNDSEYETGGQKSTELAAATKKFAEVDEWKLDFESCDVGGESSSPWR